MAQATAAQPITVGVDTHLDSHVAHANDQLGHRSPPAGGALGIGQDTAGALLVAAGDNPQRLRSEACFSMLCGSSPGPGILRQDRPAPPQLGW